MAKEVKNGQQSRFMHWYGSYKGKVVVNCVYSLGASVVIIGALFKIMHFPGAGAILMVGMIVEAFLFMIGCLEKPHPEYHWSNVFPQLLEYGAKPELLEEMKSRPVPTLLGMGSNQSSNNASVPGLSDKELESLKKGIDGLAKTATQLSELGTVATATTQLTEKLAAAGQAADQFVQAGKVIESKGDTLSAAYAQVTSEMEKVAAGTKDYEAKVAGVAKQLTSLNAIYELQLNAIQSQVDAVKAQNDKVAAANAQLDTLSTTMKKMSEVAGEALKNQEAYEAGAKQLAGQVADLNKVYGNMLNALA